MTVDATGPKVRLEATASEPAAEPSSPNTGPRRAAGKNAEYSRRARARRRGEYVEPWPRRKLSVEPGQRFGKLTVMREIPGPYRYIECACDCGTIKPIRIGNLVRGASRSCGCVSAAKTTTRNKSAAQRALITKHGLSLTPLYQAWRGMMARCYDQAHVGYKNYGARGITVCQAWHDPAAYIAWIEQNLGPRPGGCTLDRIDNDRGYEPGNLRWATHAEQVKNQRDIPKPRGTAKMQARLTEDIVRECRRRWAAGEPQNALAAEFGVSKPTMHKALVGKTWQHVA